MKPVTMFFFAACPYCQKAFDWMDEVLDEHPEYREVELTTIDEKLEPDVANQYDYWYVPTFYVGDRKVHEGAASKTIVAGVFAQAYGEQAGKQRLSGE